MPKYVNCNLCQSKETKVLIKEDLFDIVECRICGLIYQNPRSTQDEILDQFVSDRVVAEHKKQVWYDAKINLFRKNLKKIESYVQKGRLLDVGCGYGTFLTEAKNHGWQVQGVEIAKAAHDYCKEKLGLEVFSGTLKEAHFSDQYFDVVTLWEVLDLVPDPLREFKEVKRILKPDGIIALRLYNAAFHVFVQRLLKRVPYIVRSLKISPTIFHRYSFSAKTITKFLEEAGFGNIRIMPSELTSADPYATGGVFGVFGVRIIKMLTYGLSKLVFYLSVGRVVVGPSFLVFAKIQKTQKQILPQRTQSSQRKKGYGK
ncbi:MAG: class I SAM-dependent methyltransferase [Candidatus Omnitrophota bacterium]